MEEPTQTPQPAEEQGQANPVAPVAASSPDAGEAPDRTARRTKIGIVKSHKMQKSITVEVAIREKHPVYGKFIRKTNRFMAHDETNQCNPGDKVLIMETRPMSRHKRWRLVEVLEKAK